MKKNQNGEKSAPTACIKSILVSLGVGLAISFILLFLLAVLLNSKDFSHQLIMPVSIIVYIIGAFFAGFICAKIIKKNGLVFGALNGLLCAGLTILIALLVFRQQLGLLALIKGMGAVFAGCIGGIIGVNAKKQRFR